MQESLEEIVEDAPMSENKEDEEFSYMPGEKEDDEKEYTSPKGHYMDSGQDYQGMSVKSSHAGDLEHQTIDTLGSPQERKNAFNQITTEGQGMKSERPDYIQAGRFSDVQDKTTLQDIDKQYTERDVV